MKLDLKNHSWQGKKGSKVVPKPVCFWWFLDVYNIPTRMTNLDHKCGKSGHFKKLEVYVFSQNMIKQKTVLVQTPYHIYKLYINGNNFKKKNQMSTFVLTTHHLHPSTPSCARRHAELQKVVPVSEEALLGGDQRWISSSVRMTILWFFFCCFLLFSDLKTHFCWTVWTWVLFKVVPSRGPEKTNASGYEDNLIPWKSGIKQKNVLM